MCAWPVGALANEAVGPYVAREILGRGAVGAVYLAEDAAQPGRFVALKVAACAELEQEEAERSREALLHEARLLCQFRHGHIVACEAAEWDEGMRLVWLALELMDGGSLRGLLDSRRLSAPSSPFEARFVRRTLAEIGSALEYIHAQAVLHRDVKPANILLTLSAPPVLKLADFGMSRLLKSSHTESIVGTQYYFSPEVASGRPYRQASDAWALGVCLYELAALRRPFQASSPYGLARQICDEDPPALPAGTAPDLLRGIFGLLAKDPELRLPLGEALAANELVADAPSPTSPLPAGANEDLLSVDFDEAQTPLAPASPSRAEPRGGATPPPERRLKAPAVAFEERGGRREHARGRRWFGLGSFWGRGVAAEQRAASSEEVPSAGPGGQLESTPVSDFEPRPSTRESGTPEARGAGRAPAAPTPTCWTSDLLLEDVGAPAAGWSGAACLPREGAGSAQSGEDARLAAAGEDSCREAAAAGSASPQPGAPRQPGAPAGAAAATGSAPWATPAGAAAWAWL